MCGCVRYMMWVCGVDARGGGVCDVGGVRS